jgi:hypothetical protein
MEINRSFRNISRPFYQTTRRHSPNTILFNMRLTCNSRKLHSHSTLVHPSNLCSWCVRFEHRSGQTLSWLRYCMVSFTAIFFHISFFISFFLSFFLYSVIIIPFDSTGPSFELLTAKFNKLQININILRAPSCSLTEIYHRHSVKHTAPSSG